MSKQITLADIYSVVNRLEDKMDQRLKTVEEDVDNLKGVANKAMVVFGIISTVGSAFFTWMWKKITEEI